MGNQMPKVTPSQILIIAFAVVIFIGSMLLIMPFARGAEGEVSFLTALYTATSAVCVTGLSIVDISRHYSVLGQIVILVLIQLGGLGIMTFSSMIMMIIGKKITYQERKIVKEGLNQDNIGEIVTFVKKVALMAFIIEGTGAVILYTVFSKTLGFTPKAVFYSIFHSVSAFCNAGFSPYSDSLMGFKTDFILNITIMVLIVLGGIGFAVIDDLYSYIRGIKMTMSLTSYVAIRATAVLIITGTALFLLLEWSNTKTIGNLNIFDKGLVSIFQSITPRTAGFNSVSMVDIRPATVFLIIILMFIGASPGSAGGGIKTTTFSVLILSITAIIRNEKDINIKNRRISWEILNRSIAIVVISLSYILVITLAILIVEEKDSMKILFEVVSAYATVGLSMNFSAELSDISKMLIIITMFVGRLGVFTIALALGERVKKNKYRLPKENITVG